MRQDRNTEGRTSGTEAQSDELGNDPRQVGPDSAGQSGDPQRLSTIEDAADESVAELADTDQALEAASIDGVEALLTIRSVPRIPMKSTGILMICRPPDQRTGKRRHDSRVDGSRESIIFLQQLSERRLVLFGGFRLFLTIGSNLLRRRRADSLTRQSFNGRYRAKRLPLPTPGHCFS